MKSILKPFYFKEIRYGSTTIVLGLIPAILAIFVFELFIDIWPYDSQLKSVEIADNYDMKMLVYYIISGCAHMVICGIIIFHFFLSSKKDTSAPKLRSIKIVRLFFLLVTFLLVYALDKFHIALAYFSHERLYILLSKSDFFKNSFKYFPQDFFPSVSNGQWFHIFSIFPFVLICFALSVMVFGGFYIGKELYVYFDQKEFSVKNLKEYISDLNTSLKTYSQLLSVVLVSSTIATVLFFQIPISLIKDGKIETSFSGLSMAMGVCWGVIFSLTLLFLCIYPYQLVHKKITAVIQENRIQQNPELEEWLESHKSYYSFIGNFQFLISILAPAAASILTTVISHTIE